LQTIQINGQRIRVAARTLRTLKKMAREAHENHTGHKHD
jgi:hypothetical protein